jgi:integral membrane protein (TIGR01906 family)
MSEQGEIHFAEVKEIFITMQVISIAGIILFAGFMLYRKLHRVPREGTLWMRFTGIVLLSAVILIGLAMAIDWQWSFEFMHKVFFDNNYWLFDLKYDPVITILPDRFFLHCGILIVLISVTQSALLEWGYRRMNR